MNKPIILDYNTKDVEGFAAKIDRLIESKSSFFVNVERGKQQTAVLAIERAIEASGLKCRVRTANRGWAVVALTACTMGIGATAVAAVCVHDLATINPDYEIIKEMFGSDIQVEYMKSAKMKSDKE
ncbi:MAG: hypothetical protein J6T51_05990 [Kiritimatiellae bacterium]|nr:hypothetical protein [Kiritimatiellia bacterium]